MTDTSSAIVEPIDLKPWVEPDIAALHIEDTEGFPGRGRDGGRFLDCTLS